MKNNYALLNGQIQLGKNRITDSVKTFQTLVSHSCHPLHPLHPSHQYQFFIDCQLWPMDLKIIELSTQIIFASIFENFVYSEFTFVHT